RRRKRQRQPSRPAPALRREAVERPVVLGDHAVRVLRRRRALHVRDDAAGLVADPPPPPAKLPAEVDVLDVHEVPLVPSTDGVEGVTPQPDGGTRDPVDVAWAARVRVELAVPARERVGPPDEPEEPVA